MIELDPRTGRVVVPDPSDHESFILYGSYARGDFNEASDVDVLRVADERAFRSGANEAVTVHTYSVQDLTTLAREGSLFALHIVKEGIALHDPRGILLRLTNAFRAPEKYLHEVQRSLRTVVRMLDVDESLFAQAPRQFLATAAFVCRSALYAEHADRGAFSFSLRSLATRDRTAALLLAMKHATPTYSRFWELRRSARMYFTDGEPGANFVTLDTLAKLATKDPMASGLLRRIEAHASSDPYVVSRLCGTGCRLFDPLAQAPAR